ncbi:homeobox-DDT domain protein RLT3-like isoform X3 [Prunus yedoensis var. nudiflora]|uniref:Homeobox-DDT domain protein RLT3-like isoform X3 n=1 Tax=Prunus yedoensis var. nudiflora TaxID=2094558 RepID=A0A314XJP1_PRUYE|nr:homeobox-DDT domain protein RLT3-like isoform X3 [Prunus yedoensis var. nudiflora]
MPEDALLGAWKKSAHKLWVKRLRRTSSLAELLQVLGDFVGAINEDRLYKCNIVSCTLVGEIGCLSCSILGKSPFSEKAGN